MGRFRIKRGDTEVEYEGEDSSQRYQSALDWIESARDRGAPPPDFDSSKSKGENRAGAQPPGTDQQQGKRMKKGRGPAGLAKAKIAEVLIPSDFFSSPKSNEEVTNELSRRGWPIPGKRVFDALLALVKEGALDRFGSRGNYKYGKEAGSS